MIAVLDNIRSVHNVGSIFRTADAVGVEKIILAGITPAPIDRFGMVNKQLAKVALGAEKSVAWEQVSAALDALKLLQQQGYYVIALEQDERAHSLFELQIQRGVAKFALVVGAEVDGIAPEVLDAVDEIVDIPMRGAKESLNVSVAFGIAAYHYNK